MQAFIMALIYRNLLHMVCEMNGIGDSVTYHCVAFWWHVAEHDALVELAGISRRDYSNLSGNRYKTIH